VAHFVGHPVVDCIRSMRGVTVTLFCQRLLQSTSCGGKCAFAMWRHKPIYGCQLLWVEFHQSKHTVSK